MNSKKNVVGAVGLGIGIGVVFSILVDVIYFAILREPGSAFYPFAVMAFVAAPIIGGSIAAARMPAKRVWGFLIASAGVWAVTFGLFLFVYVVPPQFARTSVQLPATCDSFNGRYDPPADLIYAVDGVGDGLLLTSDGQSAVVAVIDAMNPPFPSRVFLINELDQRILLTVNFENDVISAAITDGTLILFNDKIGALIDARTGVFDENFLIIDNYGGLSESDRPFISRASDGHWYMETTGVFSSWRIDGRVLSHQHTMFNSTGRGCFIVGETQAVVDLSP